VFFICNLLKINFLEMRTIGDKIILWYNKRKRSLPWRETNDPYHIWVSEVILQQTRVEQGLAYYHRFIHLFPDIQALASATTDQVLRAWQGLGYYRRALNLHRAAGIVMQQYGGVLPLSWYELQKLPGIGDYTASAISSICAREHRPAIDGNVKRVLSRLFNLTDVVDNPFGLQIYKRLGSDIMDGQDPGVMNNAMMEFGALQCTPQSPDCGVCPLQEDCQALRAGTVDSLPVKQPRRAAKKRFFNYLVITWHDEGSTNLLVRRRDHRDIWGGMYEFPFIETEADSVTTGSPAPDPAVWCSVPDGHLSVMVSDLYPHQLTHQLINARFYHYHLPAAPSRHHPGLISVNMAMFETLAKPRLILKYLEDSAPGL
jgi:A/G-specific adenine glycosylase